MYELSCSEVWGGIQNEDVDACSSAMTTSLYSNACSGGKGGDIYYVSVCQGDVLTRVALADVVGHGEKVSRISQWLYDSLRERMNGGDGNEILADLNRLACEHGFRAITTAAVVSFQASGSEAHFSYAGHYPMLVRPEGASHWEPAQLDASSSEMANLPLGIELNMRYDQQFVPVRSKDRLLLYTDGVIETPNPDGELFGQQRLASLLDEVGDKSLYELKTTVLTALRQYAGGELAHDDVTLLAIEVH
jgi:sigma-B regulation protein RsbU (phosphoserine phosphatase)